MFFSISCSVGNSFLSFPHLIIHPIHEWSWFYRQFQFCFIVSHDEILRSCQFLRIDIIRSPWSVTRCFSVPRFRREAFPRDQFELFVPFSKKSPWSIVYRSLSFPLLRRASTVIIQFWIICWREALHELLVVVWSEASNKSVSLPGRPDLSSPATDFHGSWIP